MRIARNIFAKTTLSALMAFVLCLQTAAQSAVKGRVLDENAQPLPAAIVVAYGADGKVGQTVTANDNGQFSISCAPNDRLEVHFLGYRSAVVQVSGRTDIEVLMQPDASRQLDEVVVIGFGEAKKSDITGSVASVKMGDIRDVPTSSVDQALQGRIAGVDIMSTSGEPGAGTSIRIRGTRSISASNEPLIVVDGIMDAISDVNDINPADIESISVLKDASATAIYGARGANGVILITTKGSSDTAAPEKMNITLKADAGISMLPRTLDLMDASSFALYLNDYRSSLNTSLPVSSLSYNDPIAKGKGTDWIDEITRVAPYQNYLISLTGGGKNKFYLSLNYNDNEGIIKKSGEKKYVGTLNVTREIMPWFKLGAKVRYTYRHKDELLGSIGGTGIYHSAIYLTPLIDPHDSFNALYGNGVRVNNPVTSIENSTYYSLINSLNATLTADVTITKDLKFKSTFSYYLYDRNAYRYVPSTMPAKQDGEGGDATRSYNQTKSMTSDNTLTYTKNWDKTHHFDAMAGFTGYTYRNSTFYLKGTSAYLIDDIKWNDMGAVTDKDAYTANTASVYRNTMSGFGRLNYNYKKKYYVTFTARADGASNFAANHKWGFFPSAAFRWSISKENFMKRAKNVDDLSLKLSAGRSGNDAISPFQSLAVLNTYTSTYLFGGTQPVAYYPSRIESRNLTWEKTDLYNMALTGSFFNSRLNFTAEAYLAYTSDLLLKVQTTRSTGYSSRFANVGATSNKGVELTVESRNIVRRNFSWSSELTLSHNRQMVEDIGTEDYIATYTAPTSGYMMYGYVKGYPANALWGFQYAGVWHNEEEVERAKVTHAVVAKDGSSSLGATTYIDVNHNGVVDRGDLCYLGNADPWLYGGLQNNFRLGRFNLGVFLAYSLGGKIYNYSELYAGCRRTNQYNYMINAWHPVRNPDSNYPRAGINDGANLPSTFQVHDASFLRLKNVTLGYTFKFKSLPLKDATFSISGENLCIWTKYNGFDPDVADVDADTGTITRHMDLSAYPKARRVVFSVQLRY